MNALEHVHQKLFWQWPRFLNKEREVVGKCPFVMDDNGITNKTRRPRATIIENYMFTCPMIKCIPYLVTNKACHPPPFLTPLFSPPMSAFNDVESAWLILTDIQMSLFLFSFSQYFYSRIWKTPRLNRDPIVWQKDTCFSLPTHPLWFRIEKNRKNSHLIIHCPREWAKWAVRANERADERVAQYFSLYFWLIWPTVPSIFFLPLLLHLLLHLFFHLVFRPIFCFFAFIPPATLSPWPCLFMNICVRSWSCCFNKINMFNSIICMKQLFVLKFFRYLRVLRQNFVCFQPMLMLSPFP